MSDDWDDIGPEKPGTAAAVVEPGNPIDRVRIFDKAWKKLSVEQKKFLSLWQEARFNAARARRQHPNDVPNDSTIYRWKQNKHYAFVVKVMQADVTKDVLERERLILRHDDCVEQLLEAKPILYMGQPTGFFENQPAAAAKVNETLLRVGGHLRDEQAAAPTQGPALIVQVTNKIGGEVVQQTVIGTTPAAPEPEKDWIDADFESTGAGS